MNTFSDPTIPHLDKATIDYMDKLCPDRCPSKHFKKRELLLQIGARNLIEKMQGLLANQQDQDYKHEE